MIWNDHHLDDRVKKPYPNSNPGLCEQPSISSCFAQRLLDRGNCGRLHEMQGGRSFWTKILFFHNNGLSGDQFPDWSFKPFGTTRSLQDLDSFKECWGEGGLRLTHSLKSKDIVGQSWTRMLRDILGEEQEDPACVWIQQVNTEGGHRNIKVANSKTESITNFILLQISAFFLFSNIRKRQIALYSPCWSVGWLVDVTIIFFNI